MAAHSGKHAPCPGEGGGRGEVKEQEAGAERGKKGGGSSGEREGDRGAGISTSLITQISVTIKGEIERRDYAEEN